MDLRRLIALFRNPLHAIIIINVVVTVAIYCAAAIHNAVSGASAFGPAAWLALPSDPAVAIARPWSVVTYMFTQVGLLHLLCNMLWLWMFGRMYNIARGRLGENTLWVLYLLGGVCGAIAFMAACAIPGTRATSLIGASASTLAVIAFTAIRIPDFRINVLLFGMVKLKWIALAALAYFILANLSQSLPAAAAHIGGALAGIAYLMYARHNSRLRPVAANSKLRIANRRQHTANRRQRTEAGNALSTNEELDHLLAKINASGYASLTPAERKRLIDLSKKV